jgi:hypothetical protein
MKTANFECQFLHRRLRCSYRNRHPFRHDLRAWRPQIFLRTSKLHFGGRRLWDCHLVGEFLRHIVVASASSARKCIHPDANSNRRCCPDSRQLWSDGGTCNVCAAAGFYLPVSNKCTNEIEQGIKWTLLSVRPIAAGRGERPSWSGIHRSRAWEVDNRIAPATRNPERSTKGNSGK